MTGARSAATCPRNLPTRPTAPTTPAPPIGQGRSSMSGATPSSPAKGRTAGKASRPSHPPPRLAYGAARALPVDKGKPRATWEPGFPSEGGRASWRHERSPGRARSASDHQAAQPGVGLDRHGEHARPLARVLWANDPGARLASDGSDPSRPCEPCTCCNSPRYPPVGETRRTTGEEQDALSPAFFASRSQMAHCLRPAAFCLPHDPPE